MQCSPSERRWVRLLASLPIIVTVRASPLNKRKQGQHDGEVTERGRALSTAAAETDAALPHRAVRTHRHSASFFCNNKHSDPVVRVPWHFMILDWYNLIFRESHWVHSYYFVQLPLTQWVRIPSLTGGVVYCTCFFRQTWKTENIQTPQIHL